MVGKAISALKERGGSSRQAILKYIMANFNVGKDAKSVAFAGFLAAFTSPILKDPDAPVPFDCFKLLFFTPALSESFR
jgi:hypothetical protein